MSSLPPGEIASEEAHINQNDGPLLIILCSVFTGVAVFFACLRMTSRRVLHVGIARDDWLALVATVCLSSDHVNNHTDIDLTLLQIFLIGLNITACLLGTDGIGRHLLWVEENQPDDFNKMRIVGEPPALGDGSTRANEPLQVKIVFSFLYVFCLCFSKLSVLSLYSRIFSQSNRWVQWGIRFFTAYTILWAIAVQIAMGTATHINTSFDVPWGMTVATGVTNTVGDIGIIFVPQPMIWKLQQSLRTRMFLSSIFLLGILFVILISPLSLCMKALEHN